MDSGEGGLEGVQELNRKKAALIYDAIDSSGGFYRGCVNAEVRSDMNITFRLGTEELEKEFVKASEQEGFVGLKGHRSVGGLRASVYNALPYESAQALVQFMQQFQNSRS